MSGTKRISRRAALARLGMGAAGAYMSPAFVGLSQARASGGSEASAASAASPASTPSPASAASPASGPSAPSRASEPSRPSGPEASSGSPVSGPSGPSGPGACRGSSLSGGAQISRQDYKRAQRAIARGNARPLQEILRNVQARYPGRTLQVGFSERGRRPTFQVLIVDRSGAMISVTVDAGSAQVMNIRKC